MNAHTSGRFAWIATTVCPPQGREWVRAVLAEAAEEPGRWRKTAWMLGVVSVVATVVRNSARREIPAAAYLVAATTIAVGAVLYWLGSTDIEWHGVDDDVCLRLAAVTAGFAVLVFSLAAIRIYREPSAHWSA